MKGDHYIKSLEVLSGVQYFAWSPTSWDYVERMLAAIGGFGFFE
ncbi:MAG: hypothetical protein VZQ78_05970 [Prevotella sp.]|nr:hypothetical protein [Prevotella sp.]